MARDASASALARRSSSLAWARSNSERWAASRPARSASDEACQLLPAHLRPDAGLEQGVADEADDHAVGNEQSEAQDSAGGVRAAPSARAEDRQLGNGSDERRDDPGRHTGKERGHHHAEDEGQISRRVGSWIAERPVCERLQHDPRCDGSNAGGDSDEHARRPHGGGVGWDSQVRRVLWRGANDRGGRRLRRLGRHRHGTCSRQVLSRGRHVADTGESKADRWYRAY